MTEAALRALTRPFRVRAAAGRGAPRGLLVVVLVAALPFAAPVAYLLVEGITIGGETFEFATSSTALGPLARTLTLASSVAVLSALVGTAMAWLTVRTDVPGRRIWAVLAPLPLVFPSFVGAAALLAAVAPGGLLEAVLPGGTPLGLGDVEGFWGALGVLTLFTYPFVYLPVAARLMALPPSLEESARLLGRAPASVLRTVVLPQAGGAIGAGSLLVFLYTVSDFGAVAQLRYRTLTVEIFETRLFARDQAIALGLLLALVAIAVVAAERTLSRRRARVEVASSRAPLIVPLGRWRWPALAAVVGVLMVALAAPLSVMGWWAWRGLARTGQLGGPDLGSLVEPVLTTAVLGIVAAVVTVAVVLPGAYLTGRYRSRAGGMASAVVVGGFAVPGLLIALALASWSLEAGPIARLYQTLPLLIAAYAVHFGAQGLRAAQVAVASVPRQLDDAARSLGAGRIRRFGTVDLPLMAPGLLAGAGLVLLSTMKELPATLLLRPTGTDTLAVRIWTARESARWAETGLASLALVAISGVLTWLLVLRRVQHT
ncbi:MAG: ABC transporter permease [Acidimicrobiia bacterium]